MAESIRCPNCGATNPAGAEWCGQCHTRFRRAAPPPPPPAPLSTPQGAAPVAASPDARTPRPRGATRGAFTVSETGITWQCSSCGTVNPIDAHVCSVCGTTFADLVNPKPPRIERDPNTVAMYSLFFPGAGHWYMQLRGQAIARGVLSAWVVSVALIGAIIGSLALAIPFGITAFALWILAAHDAYREAQGDTRAVILKGRTFVYVVMGLLMLMVVLLVAAGLRGAS